MRTSLPLLLALSLSGFTLMAQPTPVDTHGALHIEGTKIKDTLNRVVELHGVSYFWHQ